MEMIGLLREKMSDVMLFTENSENMQAWHQADNASTECIVREYGRKFSIPVEAWRLTHEELICMFLCFRVLNTMTTLKGKVESFAIKVAYIIHDWISSPDPDPEELKVTMNRLTEFFNCRINDLYEQMQTASFKASEDYMIDACLCDSIRKFYDGMETMPMLSRPEFLFSHIVQLVSRIDEEINRFETALREYQTKTENTAGVNYDY